ncbi:undecaprenyldiphospho-muramoylpentapeptide beta-N-acetylglucosaminyltransferase [Pseudoflavitalea sp. G-6-1-2]|uniref:undecaprenyldiphospho-muramoylpentapeptide beta-N-acetylglucosaminyltransferase n=1 Tax=Pseudoflavitalea sp. G-6-1-2 TaxID=2728841 RepID=UPI001469D00D|nr:undecaprenyldiphospho-muramoylpentapeptide beta-N-acetylglucosaminyltransferase [Pseudoflavitalea sp. G-6-1-2]NML20754.1 undecaprenyldiphospho-muramoylpentapeptide beta-N-acetylglucosaminyltransferase [Pseudoflavitalea sp. G-6-1-2]
MSTSNQHSGKRIIIAGGGTGGHIFPAIAIANALKKADPSIEILFIGAKGKMEMEKVPQAGYTIKGIDIAGFNRSSLLKNIGLPFKLIKSFFQVRKIVNEFGPAAAIGVGGYSTFPVLKYAQAKGIPTFIHESNSFAGKSNMMLGKNATKIFVATDGMEKFFPAAKLQITGNPVREAIVQQHVTREEASRSFGLDPAKETVLVTGGSLGAKGINEAIDAELEAFAQNNVQLIWQTGKPYAAKAAARVKGFDNVWTDAFITKMENAYAAADIVVSRSGAMAIAELCVQKKPAVFVPYPFSAEDHQTVNAKHLVDKDAGLLVKDSEAREKLVPTVIALAKNEAQQRELQQNIGKLAVTNADQQIATTILEAIK